MTKNLKSVFISLFLIPVGMSTAYAADNLSLQHLQTLKYEESARSGGDKDGKNDFRAKAMKEAALAVGAQNGYIEHLSYLKNEIINKEDNMDDIYDFSLIMKLASGKLDEMHLLPPVIRKSEKIVNVSADASRIKISGELYEIVKPARLVSIAPNWRQYLIYDQAVSASRPSKILLPRDSSEEKNWKEWVREGWQAGILQAEIEMTFRSRKLGQDFKGMVKYVQLLTDGKVLKPIVSSSRQNVIGGDSKMIVDQQIIQLAMPARLNANANDWEPLFMDTRESLRQNVEKNKYESVFKND
jgi:defect-in-organelle-trafficking protein DotC